MSQVNLHTTPEFDDDLASLMLWRGIRSKAEAIRFAVHEAAARHRVSACRTAQDLLYFVEELPPGVLSGPAGPVLADEIDRALREITAKSEAVPSAAPEAPGN